jgi:hypothetical protein
MTETTSADVPRYAYPLRRILVLLAAFAAPLIGYGQMASGMGMSPADFAAQGDATVRVAPFAFAIWGLIYLWLVVYAIYQALPSTREEGSVASLGWPSFFSLAGIGLWVVASAANAQWISVIIIFASLLAILLPLIRNAASFPTESRRTLSLVVWPLAFLAGWLTIASIVNLLTVMTSQGLIQPVAAPIWAFGAVGLAAVIALAVSYRLGLWPYPLPIAWGLVGVFSAAREDGKGLIAYVAIGCAAVILIALVPMLRGRKTA